MAQPSEHVQHVRDYFEANHPVVVRSFGATYQAGLLKTEVGEDAAQRSNVLLAEHAGIRPGMRIWDAGCGSGGPAIDIARAFPDVRIEGTSISTSQVATAQDLAEKAGLADRVRFTVADYHRPPFEAESFDAVLFIECTSYSYDLGTLFGNALRLLRPGGLVYVKEVFLKEGTLNEAETKEIEEFNRMFHLWRTYPMSEGVEAMRRAGFADVASAGLDDIMSTDLFVKAMFEFDKRGRPSLTEFGKLHFREFECLPTTYGEIRARKP